VLPRLGVDEERHARFFERVAAEVVHVPGDGAAQRRAALRALAGSPLIDLFEVRLSEVARGLAERPEGLPAAVALYHMVLEGVVFLAGQRALLEVLDGPGPRLPGLRAGVGLVLRDERWHIGFGTRCLQDAGLTEGEVEALLAEGKQAAAAWGDVIPSASVTEAALLHRRRLWAAGLTRREVAA
jgi:ribonucleoside-diphosphate reductase beta chain